ncbi:DapH/DapD/GlmU-related protein [Salegentibacter sp. 24]|uniref:DapH/DapD/GlmU-related protein n=1 Tax=Salegentibacter sp. 24 TaxID=2183986 RepID=UPI00105CEC9A|nr:DapH/DapD/GlmU-related protein [Salegentibacter sp. 24]
MEKDIFERLVVGEPIPSNDPQRHRLRDASYQTIGLLQEMNNSSDPEEIRILLGKITGGEISDTTAVFPPLYINYGKHTSIGKNVFINFNCTMLGLGGITIEDGVLLAPNVSLLSEAHPLEPSQRQTLVPKPIHIRKNAWIGANATILPGVTVGENSVVAAGAVVSKDVPNNVVVGGVPAKVIKNSLTIKGN